MYSRCIACSILVFFRHLPTRGDDQKLGHRIREYCWFNLNFHLYNITPFHTMYRNIHTAFIVSILVIYGKNTPVLAHTIRTDDLIFAKPFIIRINENYISYRAGASLKISRSSILFAVDHSLNENTQGKNTIFLEVRLKFFRVII